MPGKPPLGRPLCRATTHRGDPCRKRAAAGSAYCGVHGGAKRKIGAPSKLDDALINALVETVERGVTWDVAAAAAGIHRSTLAEWRARGEKDLADGIPSLFAVLADRLTRASAAAEVNLVRTIAAQGPVDWRAAAWLLKVRHPERYGERTRVDVDVNERAQPREVAPVEERRDQIVSILAAAMRPPADPKGPA